MTYTDLAPAGPCCPYCRNLVTGVLIHLAAQGPVCWRCWSVRAHEGICLHCGRDATSQGDRPRAVQEGILCYDCWWSA